MNGLKHGESRRRLVLDTLGLGLGILWLALPMAAEAGAELRLAPGLSPDEAAAIQQQVATTLSGSPRRTTLDAISRCYPHTAEGSPQGEAGVVEWICDPSSERGGVVGTLEAGMWLQDPRWRDLVESRRDAAVSADPRDVDRLPQTLRRSLIYRPLNRHGETWVGGVDASAVPGLPDARRPLLLLIRDGRIEGGWLWRMDAPVFRVETLVDRQSADGRLPSGAFLGHFFLHSHRLEAGTLDRVGWRSPRGGGDGWFLLDGSLLPYRSLPERLPSTAPTPWDFR